MTDTREDRPTLPGRIVLLGLLGLAVAWLILGLATYGGVQVARNLGWL